MLWNLRWTHFTHEIERIPSIFHRNRVVRENENRSRGVFFSFWIDKKRISLRHFFWNWHKYTQCRIDCAISAQDGTNRFQIRKTTIIHYWMEWKTAHRHSMTHCSQINYHKLFLWFQQKVISFSFFFRRLHFNPLSLPANVYWAFSYHIDVHVIYVNFQKRGNFSSYKIHNKYQQDVNIVNISSDILLWYFVTIRSIFPNSSGL